MSEVLGFHCIEDNLFSTDDYSFTESYYDAQNVMNVLGWFPVVGSFVGAARIGATTVIWLDDDRSHRTQHKKYFGVSTFRGVTEMLSLGCLWLLPDVIVSLTLRRRTMNRVARAAKKMNNNTNERLTK